VCRNILLTLVYFLVLLCEKSRLLNEICNCSELLGMSGNIQVAGIYTNLNGGHKNRPLNSVVINV
jgi:hypothetical protein